MHVKDLICDDTADEAEFYKSSYWIIKRFFCFQSVVHHFAHNAKTLTGSALAVEDT